MLARYARLLATLVPFRKNTITALGADTELSVTTPGRLLARRG